MLKIHFSILMLLIISSACMVIYNEYLCYILNSRTWPTMSCKHEENCVKLLLVADPQLIGEKNEIIYQLTPLSIFDSDRYLLNTYSLVMKHVQPEIVIFLGDLFDEGVEATTVQFKNYVTRFFKIFEKKENIKYVYLPGDNDIGGEETYVSKKKQVMFNKTFKTENYFDHKFLSFTNVNRISHYFNVLNQKNYDENISIVISHLPIVLAPSLFVDKILERLKPKLIFTAHKHKSLLVDTNIDQIHRKITKLDSRVVKPYEFVLHQNLIREIIVPTCSYRMGTTSIGYGVATIEKSGTMKYAVLWSPSRFSYIKAYICYAIMSSVILLFLACRKLWRRLNKKISKHSNFFKYKLAKNTV